MQKVASYILSLQGTNPPNAKAPQGELYEPGATSAPDASATPAVTDTTKTAQPTEVQK
jgi:cytochrome c oxidase cbb3-type subunit 3